MKPSLLPPQSSHNSFEIFYARSGGGGDNIKATFTDASDTWMWNVDTMAALCTSDSMNERYTYLSLLVSRIYHEFITSYDRKKCVRTAHLPNVKWSCLLFMIENRIWI